MSVVHDERCKEGNFYRLPIVLCISYARGTGSCDNYLSQNVIKSFVLKSRLNSLLNS